MTAHDIQQHLLALIEGSIEDTRVPDAIAAHADKRAGKPVTIKDAEQLEAQLGVPVRIRRQYGMTHVAWSDGKGGNERSILLAHSDSNVRWPTGEELRKKDVAYFGARDERNAQRQQLLAEQHKFERIPLINPSVIERAAAAIAKIREAQAELADLVAYDEPLYVMRTDVKKLVEQE